MSTMQDLFNIMNDKYTIAMEADDITDDAESATSGVGEGQDDGEISLDTGDILGTKNNDSGDSSDDAGDKDDSSTDEGDSSDDDSAEDSDGDENSDDSMSDDSGDMSSDDPTASEDDQKDDSPFTESRKKKMKQQLLHFYDILDDSVKLVSTHIPNVTDMQTVKILNGVMKNLLQCKDIIYTLLTEEFASMEYHEILKKYIGVNRVYELCSKTLERYFELYNKQIGKNVKKKENADKEEDSDTK